MNAQKINVNGQSINIVVADASVTTAKLASEVVTTINGKITAPDGGSTGQVLKKTASGTEWANEQDISGKEASSNKVTSLSSSSTDTQYPSAKCVYDELTELDSKIGNIDTLLQALL